LHEFWSAVGAAIEDEDAGSREGEGAGDDEGEVLVDFLRIAHGILGDIAGADADSVFSRKGVGVVDGFDIIDAGGSEGVGE
jgi:hypothetical protein